MIYSKTQIEKAKKTARGGHFAAKAILPRFLEGEAIISRDHKILDFGAGKGLHAELLNLVGYNVHTYDFGDEYPSETFDVTYMSNVLNVQSSMSMLGKTIMEAASTVSEGGCLFANFPKTPRKEAFNGMTSKHAEGLIAAHLQIYFEKVIKLNYKGNTIFVAKKQGEI